MSTVSGYTDYPFSVQEFGRGPDVPGQEAPVRAVKVLSFDRNKYVNVEVEGVEGLFNIKAGYCYAVPGRCGEVDPIPLPELETLPTSLDEGPRP